MQSVLGEPLSKFRYYKNNTRQQFGIMFQDTTSQGSEISPHIRRVINLRRLLKISHFCKEPTFFENRVIYHGQSL
jgi:hypothetical protein